MLRGWRSGNYSGKWLNNYRTKWWLFNWNPRVDTFLQCCTPNGRWLLIVKTWLNTPIRNPALCRRVQSAPRTASIENVGYIDLSCRSYQTNSEWIMLLNSWYQTDMPLYSNRYVVVGSKMGGQKWQPHILCKTILFFASRLTPLVRLATTRNCTEGDTRRKTIPPPQHP